MKLPFRFALPIAAFIVALGGSASATSLLTEHFAYSSGTSLTTPTAQGGFITISGTSGQVDVSTVGLSLAGFAASSGNAVNVTEAESEDVLTSYTPVTDGGSGYTVYASCLVNFINLPTTSVNGNYFFHLTEAGSTTNFFSRTFARASAGQVQLGIRGSSADGPSFAAGTIPLGTTALIVIKYQQVSPGAANDVASIFINPTPGAAEPAASATTTPSAEPGVNGIGRVSIRQSLASGEGHGTLVLDEIRVGTTWADVTPAAASVPGWGKY